MDTKAAFEKHIRETYQYPQLEMEPDDSPCAGEYVDTLRQTEYEHWCKAWKASRAALEIDLEPLSEKYFASDIKNSFEHGRTTERRKTIDVLTSHGIRIKGKTS